jgi:hypothetical protein
MRKRNSRGLLKDQITKFTKLPKEGLGELLSFLILLFGKFGNLVRSFDLEQRRGEGLSRMRASA